eukprot:jgi/Bigna1/142399/aug1.70_g17107
MKKGKILRWNIKEGERIEMTQLLADIEVDRLLSDPSQDPGPTAMQYEGHEEGYIARLFVKEGDSAAPGVPIGLLKRTRVVDVAIAIRLETYQIQCLCGKLTWPMLAVHKSTVEFQSTIKKDKREENLDNK